MTTIEDMRNLEKRIASIEKRNKRVELDKAWETSISRKVIIVILTYIVIVIFFFSMNFQKPFTNAIVPSLGFIISTFSLPYFKKKWVENKMNE